MIVLKIPQVSVALGSKYSQKHVDSRLGTIEGDEKTLEKRRKHEERRDDVSLLFLQTHFLFMFNHCYFFFFSIHTRTYMSSHKRAPLHSQTSTYTHLFFRVCERVAIVACDGVENISGVGSPRRALAVCLDAVHQLGSAILQGNRVTMVFIQLLSAAKRR